jgi:transcriptional repressor NF-X1
MTNDKRDAIRLIADRWKLSVQEVGWEPKRFVTIHVTPKSKAPARVLGSKAGIPVSASHPYFDPMVDMDPRLVVAMLDLPREADVSSLVLRFGGECELVWLNDKNALAVFRDPARAVTALRRLDYGSAYQGAAMFSPSSIAQASSSGNVWVRAQRDGGSTAQAVPSHGRRLVPLSLDHLETGILQGRVCLVKLQGQLGGRLISLARSWVHLD